MTGMMQITSPTHPIDYSIALSTLKHADPILGRVIDRVGECLLHQSQQSGDLLDALCHSIIYQQLSGKAAGTIHRRFLRLYADMNPDVNPDVDLDVNSDRPAPTALDILNTPDDVLRGVGLSRSKVVYLKSLAQHVLDGLPTLTELAAMDDEEIIRILTQVKGIGRWTAQMVLIFRLHRWDVLPTDDLGVRSGIRRLYQLDALPDKKTVEKLAQPWQPYRTIASWYLWRSLEMP